MHVDNCVWIDGFHVIASRDCPHEAERDEVGEDKPRGWTVQQETLRAERPDLFQIPGRE